MARIDSLYGIRKTELERRSTKWARWQGTGDRILCQGRHIVFAPRASGDEKLGFGMKDGEVPNY